MTPSNTILIRIFEEEGTVSIDAENDVSFKDLSLSLRTLAQNFVDNFIVNEDNNIIDVLKQVFEIIVNDTEEHFKAKEEAEKEINLSNNESVLCTTDIKTVLDKLRELNNE